MAAHRTREASRDHRVGLFVKPADPAAATSRSMDVISLAGTNAHVTAFAGVRHLSKLRSPRPPGD
jgi:hypothetical protein